MTYKWSSDESDTLATICIFYICKIKLMIYTETHSISGRIALRIITSVENGRSIEVPANHTYPTFCLHVLHLCLSIGLYVRLLHMHIIFAKTARIMRPSLTFAVIPPFKYSLQVHTWSFAGNVNFPKKNNFLYQCQLSQLQTYHSFKIIKQRIFDF